MKILAAAVLLIAILPTHAMAPTPVHAGPGHGMSPARSYSGIPLSFEVNRGQTAPQVRFLTRARGYAAFLTPTEAVFVIHSRSPAPAGIGASATSLSPAPHVRVTEKSSAIHLHFDHADPRVKVVGLDRLPGTANYFIGNDPNRWRTDISTFARVEYQNLYPGIDLVFYGNQQQLEYDWVLHAGASPGRIRLGVTGVRGLRVDSGGNLVLPSGAGTIAQHAPRAYQRIGNARRAIATRYSIQGREIGLIVGRHDARRPLTIDPVIAFATYLGGRAADTGHALAADSSGSAYVVGDTISPDFPTKTPLQPFHGGPSGPGDIFVTKFDPTGTALVYSTYFGGTNYEHAYGVTVDSQGNVTFAGETLSHDYPVLHPFQRFFGGGASDAVVTRLNSTGDKILFSDYLGGGADDVVYALAVDATGASYLAGGTTSRDFEVRHALQPKFAGITDAFVAKVSPTGQLLWNTYLGGSRLDSATGVGVDAAGNVYVDGETQSTDLPVVNAFQSTLQGPTDAFVIKIDPTETKFLYSTHLGGNDNTLGDALAVDAAGNAYVTGQTAATNFPTLHAFQPHFGGRGVSYFYGDAFVTKLDPSGQPAYSTYLGGALDEEARSIAVDAAGNAYLTGETDSANFPIKDGVQPDFLGAYCRSVNGVPFPCTDAFITKLDASGALAWSTFWGGSRDDTGTGIAVDPNGGVYTVGSTESVDMQTIQAVHPQNTSTKEAAIDAYVAKVANGTTMHDTSLVISSAQILQSAGGHQTPTTHIHSGKQVTLVVTWKDRRKGTHPAFSTVIILRGTKEIAQMTLFPGGTKKNPNLSAPFTFTKKQATGALVAQFEVISLPASAHRALHFTLSK